MNSVWCDKGKTLVMMMGLPRSGKSTRASELSKQMGAPIVSFDSIRLAMHGREFSPEAEVWVSAVAHTMVRSLFLSGHIVVILDSTMVVRSRRYPWYRTDLWNTVIIEVVLSERECIHRAIEEGSYDLIPVIESKAASYEPVDTEEPVISHFQKPGMRNQEDEETDFRRLLEKLAVLNSEGLE